MATPTRETLETCCNEKSSSRFIYLIIQFTNCLNDFLLLYNFTCCFFSAWPHMPCSFATTLLYFFMVMPWFLRLEDYYYRYGRLLKNSIGQYTGSIVTPRYWIYTGYITDITENTIIPIVHFLWLRGGHDIVTEWLILKQTNKLVWERLICTYNQLLQANFGVWLSSSLTTEHIMWLLIYLVADYSHKSAKHQWNYVTAIILLPL